MREGRCVFRIKLDRGVEVRERAVVLAFVAQRDATIIKCGYVARVLVERGAVVGQRALDVALAADGVAARDMWLIELRIELQRLIGIRDRAIIVALLIKRPAALAIGGGKRRIELDRRVEIGDRAIIIVVRPVADAATAVVEREILRASAAGVNQPACRRGLRRQLSPSRNPAGRRRARATMRRWPTPRGIQTPVKDFIRNPDITASGRASIHCSLMVDRNGKPARPRPRMQISVTQSACIMLNSRFFGWIFVDWAADCSSARTLRRGPNERHRWNGIRANPARSGWRPRPGCARRFWLHRAPCPRA